MIIFTTVLFTTYTKIQYLNFINVLVNVLVNIFPIVYILAFLATTLVTHTPLTSFLTQVLLLFALQLYIIMK